MTLIDLGEVVAEAPETPDPLFIRRYRRRLAAALVLLSGLVLLAGSGRTETHGPHMLWSLPQVGQGGFTVVGDTLIASTGDDADVLAGYDLTDGTPRWSHTLSEQAFWPAAERNDKVLLLATGEHIVAAGDSSQTVYNRTLAVDPETGRELWQGEGINALPQDNGMALLESIGADGVDVTRLRMVRIADGSTAWSRQFAGLQGQALLGADPEHPDRVATVDDNGAVTVLRLADGAVTATGKVQWSVSSPQSGDYTQLLARGTDLFVLTSSGNRSTATSYDDRSLRQLWTVTQSPSSFVFDCGKVLCMNAAAGLYAYDWATGQVDWQAADLADAYIAGPGLLTADDLPSTRRMLLDQATGRVLDNLGTARPAALIGRGDRRVLTTDFSRQPFGHTVIGQVDPRSGESITLGVMDPIPDGGCSSADRLLICSTQQGALTVTAVG